MAKVCLVLGLRIVEPWERNPGKPQMCQRLEAVESALEGITLF